MRKSKTPQLISNDQINVHAFAVLQRLIEAGYSAFLVGGGVRDLLLGLHPKDFDIATNAKPEEIKSLFRNCMLIGRRFRLAHVRFGHDIIEVATFRADHSKAEGTEAVSRDGLILRDNVYGTLEEDVIRRDFTINALYYNITDACVIDQCGGLKDLKKKQLKIIGDPEKRYQEDPVRFLRAVRLCAKLNFNLEKKTEAPLYKMGYLLRQSAPARLFDEMTKLFLKGHSEKTFELLMHYDLFKELFPSCAYIWSQADEYPQYPVKKFIEAALKNSDKRIIENKTLNPGFMLAVLLWYPFQIELERSREYGLTDIFAIDEAINEIIREQHRMMTIPRRFAEMIREVWKLQFLFESKRTQRLVKRILLDIRFRGAYDFLLLRAEAGEKVQEIACWWKNFYESEKDQQMDIIKKLPKIRRH